MKYVFYITDHGLTAYSSVESNECVSESFEWKEVELIDAYLATIDESAEADVILDLIDEELHLSGHRKYSLGKNRGLPNVEKNVYKTTVHYWQKFYGLVLVMLAKRGVKRN